MFDILQDVSMSGIFVLLSTRTCRYNAGHEAACIREGVHAAGPRVVGCGAIDSIIGADVVAHLARSGLAHWRTSTIIRRRIRAHFRTVRITIGKANKL